MFSGIEAASVAWAPLGWESIAFAEIESFPCAFLAHHYPDVPNLGDITAADWPQFRGKADLVVGGPPCQAFSVAGLRQSLDDDRGNLSLAYVRAVDAIDPEWCVTENVPGWLSTKDNAFGCFLAAMVGTDAPLVPPQQSGGRWTDAGVVTGPRRTAAWRVIDAQYCRVDGYPRAVPQRRRRVFVVAVRNPGGWRGPAALLPVGESLSGHPAPRRKAREGIAPPLAARTRGGGGLGTDFDCDGGLIADAPVVPAITGSLTARFGGQAMGASEDGTGRGTPILAVDLQQVTSPITRGGATLTSPTLSRGARVVAFSCKDHGADAGEISPTLRSMGHVAFAHQCGGKQTTLGYSPEAGTVQTLGANQTPAIATSMAVRRLTPRECERLMGFSDDWTLVSHRGKPAADGNRYKALGNSFAVNVVRWIGYRIQAVERIASTLAGQASPKGGTE